MPRKRRKIPTYFSFEIGEIRGISDSMEDMEWGKWSKKALNDLSIGCTRSDTDPRVLELFNNAKKSMDDEYERRRKWYEENKKSSLGNENVNVALDTPVPDKASESGTGSTAVHNDCGPRRNGACNTANLSPSQGSEDGSIEVLNLAYSGEFANVRLTQEQYNDLLHHVGNMNDCKSLIDDFSASIADGSTKSDNHFATLKKWAKARKRFDSEKKDGAPTFQEREGKRQSEQLRKYGLLK